MEEDLGQGTELDWSGGQKSFTKTDYKAVPTGRGSSGRVPGVAGGGSEEKKEIVSLRQRRTAVPRALPGLPALTPH